MSIADKLIRKVEIRLDGADWPLVVTHNVLIECERLTGKQLLAGGEALRPTARLVRALLYLMLRRAGAGFALKQVGRFVTPGNAEQVHWKIIDAWAASMPDPKPEEETPAKERGKPFDAIEAWAIGHELGLSDQEWLESTPRQVHELMRRQTLRLQREEWFMAVIAASAANAPHWRSEKQRQPREFMTIYPLPVDPPKPITASTLRAAFAPWLKKKTAA